RLALGRQVHHGGGQDPAGGGHPGLAPLDTRGWPGGPGRRRGGAGDRLSGCRRASSKAGPPGGVARTSLLSPGGRGAGGEGSVPDPLSAKKRRREGTPHPVWSTTFFLALSYGF